MAKPAPVYLDPLRLYLSPMAWLSLLHRVGGLLLVLAAPYALWLLQQSLSGPAGYDAVTARVQQPAFKLMCLPWLWALCHHFLAGLRHLFMDAHRGLDLPRARRWSLGVMAGAGALSMAILAWWLA